MEKILLLIGVSVAIGATIGIVWAAVSHFTSRRQTTDTAALADGPEEVEGSWGENILFVGTIFSVLAFLVLWLVSAVTGSGVLG